nr:reverse transcriptase domain-containing protein [Tanacetum cinerariifolium]
MACSLSHTDSEVEALVQKLIDEDKGHHNAIMDLALKFENSCTAKDDLRNAYEKCTDISQEIRALIDTFLKEGSDKDYELNHSLYEKAAKLEKQMDAKLAWLLENTTAAHTPILVMYTLLRKSPHSGTRSPVGRRREKVDVTPENRHKWGINIAGPFPEGPGKVKFLIVAIDYFTKWIEAKAVATITGRQVKKFVWDNIVCRFGIPGEIISDNGKQFADNPFKDWCDKLNITQRFASVKHPQSNVLVERANRSLGEGIKARLGEGNKNWVEELPHVLWAYQTMIKSSHDDTPFSLTHGTEAVIPAKIGMSTYRTTAVDVVNNDKKLRLNLDLLEERREHAAVCEARAKSKMMKYYNARVRDVAFKPGDFVYRSNDASHAVAGGKLGPKWEGPYEVTEALGNEAYKLWSTDGTVLPRTWNVSNLKRCYL